MEGYHAQFWGIEIKHPFHCMGLYWLLWWHMHGHGLLRSPYWVGKGYFQWQNAFVQFVSAQGSSGFIFTFLRWPAGFWLMIWPGGSTFPKCRLVGNFEGVLPKIKFIFEAHNSVAGFDAKQACLNLLCCSLSWGWGSPKTMPESQVGALNILLPGIPPLSSGWHSWGMACRAAWSAAPRSSGLLTDTYHIYAPRHRVGSVRWPSACPKSHQMDDYVPSPPISPPLILKRIISGISVSLW